MRILAHIHTLNDEDVIERSLGAVLAQTVPVEGIVLVDDGSTDGTLDRTFPENVTVIRHSENLGTSGTVHTGMKFALEQGYDWIWTFDGDSTAQPDALAKLLEFYEELPEDDKRKLLRLTSLAYDMATEEEHHGLRFTPHGFKRALPSPPNEPYECAVTIWSGSLFRTDAIRHVGLPRVDYVLDWGELEYGYQGETHGYRSYIVPNSKVQHNIRGEASFRYILKGFGPFKVLIREVPPLRCYYYVRNWAYFWIHEFNKPRILTRLVIFVRVILRTLKLMLRSAGRRAQLIACLRGIWDGLSARMGRRY